MQGNITKTVRDAVTIHTYTSPEPGLSATSQLIELPTQVLIVDAQYGLPYAAEAAEFARSLGKPVSRVYISHDHPDHWFGAETFGAPVYALDSTRDLIARTGEQVVANNRALAGDFVPEHATVPSEIVAPGEETIEGVRFVFSEVKDTEADAMLLVELPDENVVIAQDLVYNNQHLFIAGGHLDGWEGTIEALRAKGYETVLPGHGVPGGPELFDFVSDYLAVARPALAAAKNGDDLKAALLAAFPTTGGTVLLDIQNTYLFPGN